MYEYIKGEIAELNPAYVVVDANGVGYYINISLNTYAEIEGLASAKIFVHFIVRDDAQILYGFSTKQERDLFRLLISVSGVGGATARMVLSTYAPKELANIISTENAALLKNVKGLGLKTSQKIIVDLRDKIVGTIYGVDTDLGGISEPVSSGAYEEAVAALTMLGFTKAVSDKAVRAVLKGNPQASVEEIIRMSLKSL